MTCDDLSRYLDLYLDGELAIRERSEVEAHLRSCEACRTAMTMEFRFRQAFRETMLELKAPRSLHSGIRARLARRHAKTTPRWIPTLAYAVSIAVVAGAGYGVVAVATDSPDPTDQVVDVHMAVSGSEILGDKARVEPFLAMKAPFATRIPIEDRDGIRLVGARVTRLGPHPAVVYLYDVNGHSMSVAQYPVGSDPLPSGVNVDRRKGYTVATWPDHGLIQTFVGDLPESGVKSFLPAGLVW